MREGDAVVVLCVLAIRHEDASTNLFSIFCALTTTDW